MDIPCRTETTNSDVYKTGVGSEGIHSSKDQEIRDGIQWALGPMNRLCEM